MIDSFAREITASRSTEPIRKTYRILLRVIVRLASHSKSEWPGLTMKIANGSK